MSDEFKAWLREICERHRDALEEIGWTEKKAKPPYVPVKMDIIDREDAIHAIYHHLSTINEAGAVMMLHEVPSVDAVEVVRCEDCKWFDITSPYGTLVPDAFYCKVNDRFYDSEHYCAYGERRE
ncbi:MAG: hypothetical protein II493_04880 [Spirochaetales bacterium]|nr:hypothetical protein [Spirochaetales bacterium]